MRPDEAASSSAHPLLDKSIDQAGGSGSKSIAAANAYRLLWAGFMAIMASGVGFSIRAGILGQWAKQYGFTQTELGAITGGGLTGFGIIILISALIADKFGYGKLMITAFVMHVISAALTLATGAAYAAGGKPAAFQCLFWGMFLFAVGNGIAEAVVNPLVATLFPKERTHYLNILHAGWPGGLIVGGLLSVVFTGEGIFGWKPLATELPWQYQISFFLVPVALYGIMLLGQRFPKSEASQRGVSYRNMVRELGILGGGVICVLLGLFFYSNLGENLYIAVGAASVLWLILCFVTGFHLGPVLLAVLLITHGLVGYVELGTDSWIGKITGAIMDSKQKGLLLFVYTSSLMFALRFFAGPIVEKTSPLGLLFGSAVLGVAGLSFLSYAEGIVLCVMAVTVYACGKTFFWPTMLAVVSEQFPRGGAITIGAIGGVGMLSAGLLGGPGIGFEQDHYASEQLQREAPEVYARYKAPKANQFLGFQTVGLDGAKVGVLGDKGEEAIRALAVLEKDPNATAEAKDNQRKLVEWWNSASKTADADKKLVEGAGLYGGRMALRLTAGVPAIMALIYLGIIFYFKTKGGYRAQELISKHEEAALMVGGVEGPGQSIDRRPRPEEREILMADPAGSTIAPKPWDKGIAPNFISLFLWIAYYDQLGRSALPLGGLFWSALGAAVAGLLCYLLLYYAPAMWGVRARIGIVALCESIFGATATRRCVGPAIGLAQVGWFAVASYYATDFALRGLVASGFLDASHLSTMVVGGISIRGPLFLVTALLWGLAYGLVGVYAVRPVAAIMTVFPLFPALVVAAATAWAIVGLNDFDPAAVAGEAGSAAPSSAGFACAMMIQLIFSFFAAAGLSSPDWGAASRDPRDVRLGGLVGVFCGATIMGILGLLIVAGAIGRQTAKQPQAAMVRPNAARAMAPNPLAFDQVRGETRASASSDQTTVGSIVQRGIGGTRGGAMLLILCLGSMAPAVYASSVFGARFRDAFPGMPRRRWTTLGTLLAFPLIALGLPGRADLLFGVLGAIAAPLLGVVAADYTRYRPATPGATPRSPRSALAAWCVGLVVGLIPTCGHAIHSVALESIQPAAVFAFLAAFAIRWVAVIASPRSSAVVPAADPPAGSAAVPATQA